MLGFELHTTSEAIDFFRASGFHAFEREWAIGKSIGIAADPSEHSGIRVWRRMVYIAPTDDGWVVHSLRTMADGPSLVGTLTQASLQAIAELRAWDCGGAGPPSS